MNCLRISRRLLLSCRPAGAVRALAPVPPQAMRNTRYYSRFPALERLNVLGSIRTSLSRHVHRSPLPPLHRRHCTSDCGSFDRWYHKPCKVAAVAALASGAAVVAVCSRYDREIVPYTNRTHLVAMSPQSEIKLWEPQDIMDKKVWASESLMVDPLHPDSIRVRLIADKVLRATYRTLNVMDVKTRVAQPQTSHLDGLKWEVGHIVARHKAEIAYTKWFPKLLLVPCIRKREMEADHIGMLLLGAAGFHPNNALKYLWKQAKIDGPLTVFENSIFAYPSYKKRMECLFQHEVMQKAMKLYRESTPDQGTVTQGADTHFSFQETLGDICNIISTRLKQALRGRSAK
ncbi:hypothetical protein ACQ4PT_018794 [Festuca glaucescens]